MIDKFPVWNLKPNTAMMMRHMACPEREKVFHLQMDNIDDRLEISPDLHDGQVIVWVVISL